MHICNYVILLKIFIIFAYFSQISFKSHWCMNFNFALLRTSLIFWSEIEETVDFSSKTVSKISLNSFSIISLPIAYSIISFITPIDISLVFSSLNILMIRSPSFCFSKKFPIYLIYSENVQVFFALNKFDTNSSTGFLH